MHDKPKTAGKGATIYQMNAAALMAARERYAEAKANFANDGREFIAASVALHAAKGLPTKKPRRRR